VTLLRGERGVLMESAEVVKKRSKETERRPGKRYGFELKLRCVKMRLEGEVPLSLLSKEIGCSADAIRRWAKAYQEKGEAGLRGGTLGGNRTKLPEAVREKIVEIKEQEPSFGIKRISHLLKRVFFLSASPETVRRTLGTESLITPPKKKPLHNITRPRFFERSTPNQLWQSDIFTFRLGGRYAYLIGFIDDYSRYMVGLELYRSQTAEQVLEVYRRAIGEYGVPKEVLTDRGRQYTNWRGITRFERELAKDRVKHIKSQAHHPMTLGKIERFWKTIFEEFLSRAQFGSFEEAGERTRQWVRYYNHKRPHQGIGGLCPADRYFEIQGELRKTIEQGIAENILEMALRGKPREPFYMVGRMEGQSVVLRAEKGKLRLMVDDKQEMVYDVAAEKGETDGENRKEEGVFGRAEVPGRVIGLVGEAQPQRGLPGPGNHLEYFEHLGSEGHGGDAPGSARSDGKRSGVEPPSGVIVRQEDQGRIKAGTSIGQTSREPGSDGARNGGLIEYARENQETGPGPGLGDSPGAQRNPNGYPRGEAFGGIPQDLLRVGEEIAQGHDPGFGESARGKAGCTGGPGEGGPPGTDPGAGEETGFSGEDHRGQAAFSRPGQGS
jgi:transposase InsO family protein